MKNPSQESGIPVLTEVIPARQPAPAAEAPAQQEKPSPAEPQQRADAEWSDETWYRLEWEVRERVLQQVLERIDFVLEQRVRDSLADVLQIAVEGIAADIKSGLHHTLKEVISRAVMQEITKLKSSKK